MSYIKCNSKLNMKIQKVNKVATLNAYMTYLFCVILLLFTHLISASEKPYTSEDCIGCHQAQTKQWQLSDHAKSMALPDASSVLANFNNQTVTHYTQRARFFTENDQYKATLFDSEDDAGETFDIKYTFGHFPLQQYLVETSPSRLQVLPFAWDSRPEKSGGQKWYHNYATEEVTAKDRVHWRQPLQNWNGMCADCHSDELTRNYNSKNNTFDSTYSHINVGCVSCHGVMNDQPNGHPGKMGASDSAEPSSAKNHVSSGSVMSKMHMGADSQVNQWLITPEQDTAIWQGKARDNRFMDSCFACHALRAPLEDGFKANKPFLDQFTPSFVIPPNYFADGQIKEEVYVYGSFLQSKMYDRGVNCLDCHDSHTMKLKIQGNGLCLQCHKASVFETKGHYKHEPMSQGAQCVNCHMPDKTYMGVDNRRDHSFKIPRPDLSLDFDTLNACTNCHSDKTNQWASKTLEKWFGQPKALTPARQTLLTLRHGQRISKQAFFTLLEDETIDALSRASALDLVRQVTGELSASALRQYVQHNEPLIRLSAARAGELVAPGQRAKLLAPLLNDQYKAVRAAAAQSLLTLQVAKQDSKAYAKAFQALLTANEVSAWRGEGRVNQGSLAMQTGDFIGTEIAYKSSIEIDPYFPVGYLNLADLYRGKGLEELVSKVLLSGMENVPQSAEMAYAYGLHLVRIKQLDQAIEYFNKAMLLDSSNAQLAYTYILAMDGSRNATAALPELMMLIPRYQQPQQLVELGMYLAQKHHKTADFKSFLKQLNKP
ncbi:MAG: putative CXXCH cytochrome family protein [Paraglaciecola sp.]|jgi:predicted CXXCH cytochrome family protein